MSTLIKKELVIEDYEEPYWTDSKVILGYINNEIKHFKIYQANKVKTIKYISSKDNPANDGSRGLDVTKVN